MKIFLKSNPIYYATYKLIIDQNHLKTKANFLCFLAVLNEKPSAAQPCLATFTKSPEEGAVVTTELVVSKSAAQQDGASSIESAEVKYLLNLCEMLLNLNYYS